MEIQSVKNFLGGYLVLDNKGIQYSITPDSDSFEARKIREWIDRGGVVDPEFTNSEIKTSLIEKIKLQAFARIAATYPEYKQRNLNGAVSNIQNKEVIALKSGAGNYTPTSDEMVLLRAAKTCKDFIDGIRAKSNQLEASLDLMTEEQLNAFDPSEDSNWE